MSQTKAQLIDTLVQPITGADGTQGAPTFSFTDDTDTGLFRPGDNQVAISTGGTQRLLVENTGLTVNGTTTLNGTTLSLGAEGGANGFINTPESLFFNIDSNNGETGKVFVFAHNDTGQSGSELLRIQDNGRVGIGTSSPSSIFDVQVNTSAGVNFTNSGQAPIIDFLANSVESAARIQSSESLGGGQLLFATKTTGGTLTNRLLIDENGRVGVGTTSPAAKLDVRGNSTGDSKIRLDENGSFQAALQLRGNDLEIRGSSGTIEFFRGNANEASSTEIARFDTSGRLLVGTTSDTNAQFVVTAGAQVTGAAADANADRATLDYSSGVARLMGHNSSGGEIRFFTNASGSGVTERVTIGSTGNVLFQGDIFGDDVFSRTTSNSSELHIGCRNAVGTKSETCRAVVNAGLLVGRTTDSFNNAGTMLWTNQGGAGATGAVYHERDSASTTVMWLHHIQNSAGGTFCNLVKNNSTIGNITFSGTTVSYNPFLGSHWAALTDRSKPNLLPGTILETVNQLMEWKLAVFTVNGETKKMAWNGTENVGDTVTVTYEGSDYTATIQLEDDAEELNKHVCVKVNDTAGSSAVFGVFLGWDDTNADGTDKANPIIGAWNDMNVAAVGNYFIRIASGQTVAIGDLIEADGSGCGVVQSDDIIRSKTVAKVTSTTAQETYDDGSFLVTCVLCCG